MEVPFPFSLPGPTIFYLVLYVLTLVLHAFFMSYVLAGTAWLAADALFRRRDTPPGPLVDILRDWMPFMVTGAITAGVAPLLFVQILYQEAFYTANLLLFHRWMAILPVLIVGFYLLYVVKTKRVRNWPIAGRAAVSGVTFACFAFIAWSWTENHLLSLQPHRWADVYAAGSLMVTHSETLPRLTMWFAGTFPGMAILLAWQLRSWHIRTGSREGVMRLSTIALSGLAATVIAGAAYLQVMRVTRPDAYHAVTSSEATLYIVLIGLGVSGQAVGWWSIRRRRELREFPLLIATKSLGEMLVGIGTLREMSRASSLPLASLAEQHAAAADVGGLSVFLVFAVLNTVLIAACFRLVRRGLQAQREAVQ